VLDRVTVEPGRCTGQPCIRGLRSTVAHLLRLVATGWDLERIKEEYPFVEAEDVQQAAAVRRTVRGGHAAAAA